MAVLPAGWYRADLRFFDASVVSDTKLAVLMREVWRTDLEVHPRDEAHTPEWLRSKLVEGES